MKTLTLCALLALPFCAQAAVTQAQSTELRAVINAQDIQSFVQLMQTMQMDQQEFESFLLSLNEEEQQKFVHMVVALQEIFAAEIERAQQQGDADESN